ncbi:MAG TPA: hypothetical protein PLU53_16090, partial [Bacteroidia bacterium]|nr:hypothetical protein [Bacteroidia bacterium]
TGIFQSEYWLGHGGFIAGAAKKGFMIPSADELSSLQLDPVARRCFLNFDLNLDHPLLRFPLLRGKKSVYEDLSRSCFSPGDTLLNSFTVYTDWKKKSFPRLMKNPEGRTAALIWTEHADYTDMQTQKAIFFGSDSIQHASDAVAGFVKNRIPVTKSVFYSNPDKVMNSDKAGFVKSESASIKNTSGFRDFLVELQKEGNEICLHTPEHYTTTRSMLNEALEETEKIFHPVSWIDHGYDNAVKSNREDLACDGLDSSSRYYAADLWLKHGLKYFWNSYYEDSAVFAPYVFYSFLTVPYSGWGDRFPVPEFWEHPSRSRSLLHWRTMNTLDLPDGGLWQYCMSESKLNDLVLNRGTCIIHSYPARLDSTTGFYRREKNHFYIDPEFEKVLQRQSAFRDEGSLNLTTIRDYLDYQQAIAKVDCMPVNGNQVKIKNGSPVDLKSLSFSVKGMQLIVKGKEFKSKKQADDTIFWFDLNTGEEVLISWE